MLLAIVIFIFLYFTEFYGIFRKVSRILFSCSFCPVRNNGLMTRIAQLTWSFIGQIMPLIC